MSGLELQNRKCIFEKFGTAIIDGETMSRDERAVTLHTLCPFLNFIMEILSAQSF